MRKNPHVRICGGLGSATTLVYPTGQCRRSSTFGGADELDVQQLSEQLSVHTQKTPPAGVCAERHLRLPRPYREAETQ